MEENISRNKAAVLAHFSALDSGEYQALEEIHLASGRNHAQAPFDVSVWPTEGVPFGPDEVRGTFAWLRSSMPDLRVELNG